MDFQVDTLLQFFQDYMFWIIAALVIAAVLPIIMFCLTLQKALIRCSPENRLMSPAKIWLLLIPVFNVIWNFYVVSAVAKSLSAEFAKRNLEPRTDFGQDIGRAMAIFTAVSMLPSLILALPASLVAAICLSFYWVKIARLSRKLAI